MKTKIIILTALLAATITHSAEYNLGWKWGGDEFQLDRYRLLIDKQTDGTFEEAKEQSERVNGFVIKRIRVTIPDGETYAFRVVAVMKDGLESDPSNRLIVKAPSLPPAPVELNAEIVQPE